MPDRLDDMLERYGEVCTKKLAAKILGRSNNTPFEGIIARPRREAQDRDGRDAPSSE